MSIEKILAQLPQKSAQERAKMQQNALRLLQKGDVAQQLDAQDLLDALAELEPCTP